MAPLLTACSGFLLAVLWMDLIFDVQVLRHRADLPEAVLASIAAYYLRATTTSRPMSRLIVLVMLILLAALGFQAAPGHDRRDPGWLLLTSAILAAVPMLLALTHTVPSAVRLGQRTDSPPEQSRLARAICRDHFVCAASMLTFLVLWTAQSVAT
jgi:hypothetical protein